MKRQVNIVVASLVVMVGLACSVANQVLPRNTSTLTTPTIEPTQVMPTATVLPSATPAPTATPPPIIHIGNADKARFQGDWERAIVEYQAALSSQDPEIQDAALLGMGRTYQLDGQTELAIETLTQLIQRSPDSTIIPYAHFALGQAYEKAGEPSKAAQAYLDYLTLRSGIIDGYVLNLRGDALRDAGRVGEALVDYRASLTVPSLLDKVAIEIKIARAHATMGDYGTALGMYQDIYNRSDSDYTKAQMDYLMGQAYTALGQMEQAYAVYQDAVNQYPTAYDSYLGLLILVEAGVPVNELNRGIVDYFAGQYSVAAKAFGRYLQAGGGDPSAARYYLGLSLRALGANEDAIAEWQKIIQNFPESRFWDRSWEEIADTQWLYLRQPSDAVQTLLNFVSIEPNHHRAGEFLFRAGRIAEQSGEFTQAAEIWGRVANEYPGYPEAQQALFLAGITRFRLADFEGAFALFQRGLENAVTLEERTAAYFWQGKARQSLGDQEGAEAAWEHAANLDPTGYYSERARDLMLGREPFALPQFYDISVDPDTEKSQAETWIQATFGLPPGTDLSTPGAFTQDPNFIRGSELWELGLYDEARDEFDVLRSSLQNDPIANFQLSDIFIRMGLYRSAIFSARQVLNLAGMSDAETLNAPIYFNHIRFGTYYSEIILPAAESNGLHPLLVFSVVRQESAFEGFVRSTAGARGLMQIVPTTGDEIAAEVGWPEDYTSEDLYRPQVSVILGTDYLAKWRDHFQGDLYAALAAYNAGPGNAIDWVELAKEDPDVFLEIIPYQETRNYIRSIYEIFNIYRRLYNRTP